MQDVEVALPDRPGALADLGETLGAAGIPLEGGGVFTHEGVGLAHFLVGDGPGARAALERAGMQVVAVREVVTLRLQQGVPGQLGPLARRMAEAGVNIRTQYSDHDHRLVLVVDDQDAAAEVAAAW